MPCVNKEKLRDQYNEINAELNKIWDLTIAKQIADGVLYERLAIQKCRLDNLKNKHDKLTDRFKDYRKSILYYICKYLTCCFCGMDFE